MPLVTTADTWIAPGITLTDGMILRAEALAYGPQGSGYDLELTPQIELKQLNRFLEVYPSFPIANLATATVAVRSPEIDNEWTDLTADTLEITKYKIRLKAIDGQFFARQYDFGRRQFGRDRPLWQNLDELRISYTSGLDFAANTQEIKRLQAALGQIITAQHAATQAMNQLIQLTSTTGTGAGQQLVEKSVLQGRATVKYSDPGKAANTATTTIKSGSSSGGENGAIADALLLFQRYRMRDTIG